MSIRRTIILRAVILLISTSWLVKFVSKWRFCLRKGRLASSLVYLTPPNLLIIIIYLYTTCYVHNSSCSILGKEHFYVLDGFTLVNGREVHDINFIPTTYYEPIIPQVPGHSIYIRTVSPKLFGKNENKLTQRVLSPCYSLVYSIPCWLVWGTN